MGDLTFNGGETDVLYNVPPLLNPLLGKYGIWGGNQQYACHITWTLRPNE